MFEQLPFAVLSEMVEYLNPRERQRFAAANRVLKELFPMPLRIKIASKSTNTSLEEMYFVSLYKRPSAILSCHEALVFEKDYVLWTYDYTRENKVFLCRNHVEWGDTGTFEYLIFSVGLRSKDARQSIRIMGGKAGHQVHFGENVGVTFAGLNADPTTADSRYRSYLSVQAIADSIRWYSMVQEWGKDEVLQLHRWQDYAEVPKKNEERTPSTTSLTIHAMPDIADGIFHLFSPKSLDLGSASSEMVYHKIRCNMWIEKGYICVRALVNSMACSFAVPIIETDGLDGIQNPVNVMNMLWKKDDARWEGIKYYLAIALDLSCGRSSRSLCDILNALASCDESGTSTIAHDAARSMVYMQVDSYIVTARVPDCACNENERWECLVLDDSHSFPWIR
ncbi:unnamed protein product [Cylindrotheca closterium]|uniref:F-box domain-containing protein n=1 Tax=Cylindrotheca closterium TaxID=2856 RepID=A0AAD2GC99_9STRA|nr:unnamed protein product [Cylindrotheca closterium]